MKYAYALDDSQRLSLAAQIDVNIKIKEWLQIGASSSSLSLSFANAFRELALTKQKSEREMQTPMHGFESGETDHILTLKISWRIWDGWK